MILLALQVKFISIYLFPASQLLSQSLLIKFAIVSSCDLHIFLLGQEAIGVQRRSQHC